MTKYFYIPVILLALFATSCCKKRHYCRNGNLRVGFVGFQYSEARSLVLKRYSVSDTVRTKALDSSQLVYSPPGSKLPDQNDTLWLSDYKSNGVLSSIYYGNTWTITFSVAGRYYVIDGILDEEHRSEIVKCNDKETDCVNNIKNFALNGQWLYGDVVYVPK